MDATRCLMTYPFPIDQVIGAQIVLLAYARALSDMGIAVDCFAPYGKRPRRDDSGRYFGVFDRLFTIPDQIDAPARRLASPAPVLDDLALPDPFGRDSLGMMSAALLASSGEYDLVGVHYMRCHSIVRVLPRGMRRMLFTYELDAEVLRQMEALGGTRPTFTLEDEVARMTPFDLVTAIGPHDLARIRATAPGLNVVEAPFCPERAPVHHPRHTDELSLLLVSSDAGFHQYSFEWFWRHVWPSVRQRTRLTVAGSISRIATELGAAADPHVNVLGVVPSLDALYASADVIVAPYCFGGGIKTKVVEALAQGFPVVTTSAGLTNSRACPGRDLLAADDAAGFAAAIVSLADSLSLRESLSRSALQYVAQHHETRTAYRDLQAGVRRLLDEPAPDGRRQPAASCEIPGLERLVPEVVHRCRGYNVRRAALFGAGSHTAALLPLLAAYDGPSVATVIVSKPGGPASCLGLPVVCADQFDPSTVDGIILSSQIHEVDMAATCAKRWPALPVFDVWQHALHTGAAHIPLATHLRHACGPVIPPAIRDISIGGPDAKACYTQQGA